MKCRMFSPKESKTGWFFILPQFLVFVIFYFYPIVEGFRLSLYNVTAKSTSFIGFGNYVELFADPVFHTAVKNTLIYVVVIVSMTIGFGLFVASAVFDKRPGYVSFIRGCYYLPYMVSMVVMAMVWNFLLNPANGLVCYILRQMGCQTVNLLGNKATVLPVIIFVTFVFNAGQAIILFIAAMLGVSADMLEAAEIDGANRLKRIWHIVIPSIQSTMLYVTVINIIGVLKMFVAVQLLTAGGPNNASTTIMYYLYKNAFTFSRTGYSSAVGVIMFLIAIIMLIPMFHALGSSEKRKGS